MSAAIPIADLAAAIEQQLGAAGNPERAVQEKRYLRSDLDFLGAGVPAVPAVAVGACSASVAVERT